MAESARSVETRVLNRCPKVRAEVLASSAFVAWRDTLKSVDLDGETLYVRGGDILRDEDQVIFEWARKHGLLTDYRVSGLSGCRQARSCGGRRVSSAPIPCCEPRSRRGAKRATTLPSRASPKQPRTGSGRAAFRSSIGPISTAATTCDPTACC